MALDSVKLENFRGLTGSIELGTGLNILVGPNCAGKTALIEALAHVMALNYTDLRVTNGLLFILHAARGSERHSIASLIPQNSNSAKACVIYGDREACIKIEKKVRIESKGVQLTPIVEVSIKSTIRDCEIMYSLGQDKIGISLRGKACIKEEGPSLGVVTPGILPFNFFDSMIGKLKRENPNLLEKMTIVFSSKKFSVDVASDEWDMLSAYVTEHRDSSAASVSFYSIGRGLQRALLLKLQLELSDVILVDEIESAMHPELLAEVSKWIALAVDKNKQIIVTTQSLEATRFLVAAVIGAEKEVWRDPYKLSEIISKKCENESYIDKLSSRLNLIILNNVGGRLNYMKLEGCDALQYVMGAEDVRMSYVLI